MNKTKSILLAGLPLAILGKFSGPKIKPRKDVCVECQTKIMPGKAGRKCKDCREKS